MHISLCTLIYIHFISEIYYVRKAQIFNRVITLCIPLQRYGDFIKKIHID